MPEPNIPRLSLSKLKQLDKKTIDIEKILCKASFETYSKIKFTFFRHFLEVFPKILCENFKLYFQQISHINSNEKINRFKYFPINSNKKSIQH